MATSLNVNKDLDPEFKYQQLCSQYPDLMNYFTSLINSKFNDLTNTINNLQSVINGLTDKLNNHTHTYQSTGFEGETSFEDIRELINSGNTNLEGMLIPHNMVRSSTTTSAPDF